MHILIIGSGSVGKRHGRNFASLQCEISAFDPRADRLKEIKNDVGILKNSYSSFDDVIVDLRKFDGVVIASPPKFHIEQAIAVIESGVPLLLEKPLCPTLNEAQKLKIFLVHKSQAKVILGYTYRWWEPLREMRDLILSGKIGKILHTRFVMSAHLADWHPWEKYQDFFMASRDLGGGALLDESHFIDLMYWFFGMPKSVFAKVEKLSDLEIETDDNVDALFAYENGSLATMHLDLFGRPHEKYIIATGNNGSIYWSFEPNEIRITVFNEKDLDIRKYNCERNDMFLALARDFVKLIGGQDDKVCAVHDGIEVMKIIEACRQSSILRKEIEIL